MEGAPQLANAIRNAIKSHPESVRVLGTVLVTVCIHALQVMLLNHYHSRHPTDILSSRFRNFGYSAAVPFAMLNFVSYGAPFVSFVTPLVSVVELLKCNCSLMSSIVPKANEALAVALVTVCMQKCALVMINLNNVHFSQLLRKRV